MNTPATNHPKDIPSVADPRFLRCVESWLQSRPEILVLIRYSHAAGSKDFEFSSSFAAFSERLRHLPPATNVIVFKQHQLPIRGVVDEGFIAECLNRIPNGTEFLLVETERSTAGDHSWFHHVAGESHAELHDALAQSCGRHVAVGIYPPWCDNGPGVLSGVVPDPNGDPKLGVY